MKRLVAGVAAVGLIFALSACANDPLAQQFKAGTNKNYVAGDGSVTEFNGKLVSGAAWDSKTFDGQEINSKSLLGHVTVLNFWYAGCAPCRAETPDLAKISSQYETKGVYVVGVNVRDTAATAAA